MKRTKRISCIAAAILSMLLLLCGTAAFAEEASGDNSLSSLGITTEGAVVSPEFYYSTIEYNVTVPAGTTEITLEPVTSNPTATILDISGTVLENGEGTVAITVEAANGSQCTYYLYVTADESVGTVPEQTETEPQTEPETEPETEPQTEDPRYVRVDRESLTTTNDTIETLREEVGSYRDRVELLTNILYGMIAFAVILLFVVVNLLLKKKDLKSELESYREFGYEPEEEPVEEKKKKRSRRKKKAREEAPEEAEEEWQEPVSEPQEEPVKEPEPAKDDPSTVPKPSKARKKAKPMPKYEKPEPAAQYEPPKNTEKKDVEINMIDL